MNSKIEKIKNEDLGYDAFFESGRRELESNDFSVARVAVEYKGAYKVRNENGEYLAKVTGKQMFESSSREDFPAVGDWVTITELEPERAVIHGILPRKTMIKRKHGKRDETQIIATNINVAFVVEAVGRDYNLNRFERYLAIADDGGVKPVIILNKTDLISKEELDLKIAELKKRFGDTEIIATSAKNSEGLKELKARISKGKTYCFLGSSGVGKSSLINELLGEKVIKTEDISLGTNRGKHTTTNREMYFLKNGGIVIDNPGMRGVGMTNTSVGINNLFDQITALSKKCKFSDCAHISEPGCKVLSALKSGELDKGKYLNYINLKKEAEHYELTNLEKRKKDREFGKFIKKAKKELREHGHKNY